MKASFKILTCAFAVSLAFLACSDVDPDDKNKICKNNPSKIKALSKTCNEERCWYDEGDSALFRPYNHNWVYIEGAVKEWMEEQFATGKNDTGLFVIVDLFIHENYFNTLDVAGPIEREYYVDGRRVSIKEYNNSIAKIEEYEQERACRGKRNLHIPDPIFGEAEYSTSAFYFGVPMTAREIYELTENYKILSIEFFKEAVNW